jgi:methylglutaconyl-CoA hydratase
VSALRIERNGEILRVTLARPERRNAFDAALIGELTEAFADVGDARAVVLAGDGPSFCAGADVEWQRASIDLSYEENVADSHRLYRMLETIDACPPLVVARVQGYALGGGSGLVACADVAVAAEDAVFGFSEVKLGIIPAVISPFVLAKIGPGAGRRYFLTGERFRAAVAHRIGLVHEVVADLDEAVERVLQETLTSAPLALRAAKRLVRERPEGIETAEIAARLRSSPEGQDGLRAFLERRAPRHVETLSEPSRSRALEQLRRRKATR